MQLLRITHFALRIKKAAPNFESVLDMEKGLISTIQGYSTKDGPGIRSTVFCVACNLRCKWCSNPELMLPDKKIMKFKIGDTEKIQNVGYEIESKTLAEKLARDKIFYEETGGGVTFSGGEAALQGNFIAETAKYLNQLGISSALDTAGNIDWQTLDKISDEVEYILYDIKTFDDELHKKCTGVGNKKILENLKKLADKNKKIIIRLVIVPQYNDDLNDVQKRFEFIKSLGDCIKRVDVLPYHTLGKGKYKSLGIDYPIKTGEEISAEYWQKFKNLADNLKIKIHIAGED